MIEKFNSCSPGTSAISTSRQIKNLNHPGSSFFSIIKPNNTSLAIWIKPFNISWLNQTNILNIDHGTAIYHRECSLHLVERGFWETRVEVSRSTAGIQEDTETHPKLPQGIFPQNILPKYLFSTTAMCDLEQTSFFFFLLLTQKCSVQRFPNNPSL